MTHVIEMQVQRGFEDISPIYEMLTENEQARGFVAGSYAAWMMMQHEKWQPNDVDIFATSEAAITEIDEGLRSLGFQGSYESNDLVKRYHWSTHTAIQKPIQVITPHPNWSDFPLDIVLGFDLSVCRAVLTTPVCGFADVGINWCEGVVLTINNPLRTAMRILKYNKRGIEFLDTELIKLFKAWDSMTPDQKKWLIDNTIPPEHSPDEFIDYEFDWDDHFFTE